MNRAPSGPAPWENPEPGNKPRSTTRDERSETASFVRPPVSTWSIGRGSCAWPHARPRSGRRAAPTGRCRRAVHRGPHAGAPATPRRPSAAPAHQFRLAAIGCLGGPPPPPPTGSSAGGRSHQPGRRSQRAPSLLAHPLDHEPTSHTGTPEEHCLGGCAQGLLVPTVGVCAAQVRMVAAVDDLAHGPQLLYRGGVVQLTGQPPGHRRHAHAAGAR